MPQDDIQSKVITVESIQQEMSRTKIRDTDGVTFSFFYEKRDGTPSKAFETFNSMSILVGSVTEISYVERPGEYQGRPITYRNILSFNGANKDRPLQINQNKTPTPTPTSQSPDLFTLKEISRKLDLVIKKLNVIILYDPSIETNNASSAIVDDEINVENINFNG